MIVNACLFLPFKEIYVQLKNLILFCCLLYLRKYITYEITIAVDLKELLFNIHWRSC